MLGTGELTCTILVRWERFPDFERWSDLTPVGPLGDGCLCYEYLCDNCEWLCDWCDVFYVLEKRVFPYLDDIYNCICIKFCAEGNSLEGDSLSCLYKYVFTKRLISRYVYEYMCFCLRGRFLALY